MVVLLSVTEWILLLARKRLAKLCESEPVWLPAYAVAEGKPLQIFGLFALGLGLLRELSGEAHIERVRATLAECSSGQIGHQHNASTFNLAGQRRSEKERAYVQATQERFQGVRRCC